MAKRQARPSKSTRSAATGRKRTSGATKKATASGRKKTDTRAKTTGGVGWKRTAKARAKTKRTRPRAAVKAVKKRARKATRAATKTTRTATRAAARRRTTAPAPEATSRRRPGVTADPAEVAAARGTRAGGEGLNSRNARQGRPAPAETAPAVKRGARTSPAPDDTRRSRRDKAEATGEAPLPGVSPDMLGGPDEEPAEEPLVQTPTSFNFDLRRTRKANVSLEERFDPDPQSALAVAAGDHDVSPESAEAVGDETPGGDNPTPDMDVVDLIGRSLGVEYEDNEELKGADKITARDRKRWELDPASAEDFKERNRS